MGFLLALHTWGRNLSDHPHIHCLISHGGLDEQKKWRQPRSKHLLPAEIVKRMFRGKLIAKLKVAIDEGKVSLPNAQSTTTLINLLNKLGRVKWQVYACKPYSHGFGVAKYLARYLRGGALKNHQILGIKAEQVLFKYRDHRTHKMVRSRYAIADFERQILRHLPLPNQQMIRYYGFYHPSQLVRLNQARQALGQADYKMPSLPDWQAVMDKYGLSIDCVICAELRSTSLTSSLEELKTSQQD
ncbi:transposase [Shewanella sp. 10N.286.54.B9]|uniref:IS91 family transposase n=1 Tax=Shewanella sp. 10N.286.54.B9 TaxID=3229719 RepID=UPI003553DA92